MFLRIEPSSGVPIWRQIADQIRSHCATGTLSAGDQLPSVRELARELAVNQNTILHVYERLTAEGLLERRHGSGTYVAANIPTKKLKAAQRALLTRQLEAIVRKARALGVSGHDLLDLLDHALKRPAPKTDLPKTERTQR